MKFDAAGWSACHAPAAICHLGGRFQSEGKYASKRSPETSRSWAR